MRKRDLFRYVPGLSRVSRSLDALEQSYKDLKTLADANHELSRLSHHLSRENGELVAKVESLNDTLHQVIFAAGPELIDAHVPPSVPNPEGLPFPAGFLRYLVAGTADVEWFSLAGRRCKRTLDEVLARRGLTLEGFRSVLDFGCGCGRVLRHLKGLRGPRLHGTDPNGKAVEWCRLHLPFGRFEVGSLRPPLPYPDGAFDFLYAFSIFTHLTRPLQDVWMAELRRVLAPGGIALITVHGDSPAHTHLEGADREAYDRGELVVRDQSVAGANLCAAYHPERYVREVFAAGFEVLEFVPQGDDGVPPQDAYLLRVPG